MTCDLWHVFCTCWFGTLSNVNIDKDGRDKNKMFEEKKLWIVFKGAFEILAHFFAIFVKATKWSCQIWGFGDDMNMHVTFSFW